MRNKKLLSFAMMLAVTASTIVATTDNVVAKSHHCCPWKARDVKTTEVTAEAEAEEVAEEATPAVDNAALMEKCKNLTPYTRINDEIPQERMMIVETKTGVNIYREYAYIDYTQVMADEYNLDETYYNATINNPEDLELVYSTDGNDDLSDIHIVCEVGLFKIAGEELKQEGYKAFETVDIVNGIEGNDWDLDSSYFKVAALNQEEGSLTGKVTCTKPSSKVKYHFGEGLYGGGYVFYSQFQENSDYVDCNVGYDIQVNPDSTIKLTIGAYNEEENFATTVEYNLVPGMIAYGTYAGQ